MTTNQYPTISFLAMQDLQNRKDLFVIRANGDSMSPKINDGDKVTIRKVEDLDCIYYGQNYLVVTKNYKMIKQIRRYTPDEDNYVILHSINPNYDDMVISKSNILGLYVIQHVISFKQQF